MKKLFVISFALLYGLMAMEATVNIHSCMGQLVSVTLDEKPVSCCGSEQQNDCCSNDILELEDQSEEKLTSYHTFHFAASFVAELVNSPVSLALLHEKETLITDYSDSSPPDAAPLYILYSSFTFYG